MNILKWIYWFNELGKEDSNLVGKKCANLGESCKAGFRVPPGFALSLDAYKRFMTETGCTDEIKQFLASFSADPDKSEDLPQYEQAAKTIRAMVESKRMPSDMEKTVRSYYRDLCTKAGVEDMPVAIRSAGPASHPGQYETYLHVKGAAEVVRNIIRVWSSTFNGRSLIARARGGYALESDPIGVGVLAMVDSKAAGVMFTLNPGDGDPSKILIEGTWGLGEALVSGSVNPDRFVIDKVALDIEQRHISTKHTEYAYDGERGEVVYVDLPIEKQDACCLCDDEITELAKVGSEIEKYYGCPQDIEWAIDKNYPFPENVFIVQCRPETVWSKRKKKSVLGKKSGYELLMDRAMKRIKINEDT